MPNKITQALNCKDLKVLDDLSQSSILSVFFSLVQGWAKYGPRAKSGPLMPFAWPAEYIVNSTLANYVPSKIRRGVLNC